MTGERTRGPVPRRAEPMLATPSLTLPDTPGHAFEMKWDGVRALALVEDGTVRLTSRNGNDITDGYPELRALKAERATAEMLLDGEIVAFDDAGHSSFEQLQLRMHLRAPVAVRRMMTQVPVVYVIFDVLWLDGHLTMPLPYLERREILERLHLAGPSWQTPSVAHDNGEAALEVSRQLGFEGVVAKEHASPYRPGRSRAWVKVKHQLRQEFVIGGWQLGAGARRGRVGSLLLGYYEDGALRFAGRVGTGFSEAELDHVSALLAALEQSESPFEDRSVPPHARFCKPRLVVEVRFTNWTRDHHLRQPVYLGLRDDKGPTTVVRESR